MNATSLVLFSNGMKFGKAGDAEAHFRAILNTGEMRTYLVGAEPDAVGILFRDYCYGVAYAR